MKHPPKEEAVNITAKDLDRFRNLATAARDMEIGMTIDPGTALDLLDHIDAQSDIASRVIRDAAYKIGNATYTPFEAESAAKPARDWLNRLADQYDEISGGAE